MSKLKSVTCCVITSIIGALVVVLLAAVSFPVVHDYMKKEITKRVLLVNGSQLYENWKEPTIPIYMQIYVFDLQNAAKVKQGDKPFFRQRGPFTYREHKVKTDIQHYDNGTLSYREVSTYYFDPDMSPELDTVNITSINIPIVALMDYLEVNHYTSTLEKLVLKLLLSFLQNEDIFITRSVREIVWGYEEPLLDFIKKQQEKFHITLLNITTDIVGVFGSKNNTDDGLYTIFTGEKNISLLGVIDRFNGVKKLNFWTTKQANMINGSDGTLCPPFIVSENLKVELFSTDICRTQACNCQDTAFNFSHAYALRSVSGVFQYKTKTEQGIELYRYSAPKEVFEKPSVNPANAGFCTPAGNCMGTGVLNVSVCQKVNGMSLPIVVSYPHFFMAEKKYQDAVYGLNPNLPHLSTDIDIEPHTGLVMQVAKRLQLNVFLKSSNSLVSMQKVPTLVFPVLWVNESVTIDNKTASQFKSDLLNPLTVVLVLQIIMFGTGGFLILLAAIMSGIWLRKKNPEDKDEQLIVNSD